MIKEQKEKKKIIFPASEIERAENIVRIEIRCMELYCLNSFAEACEYICKKQIYKQ